MKLSLYVQIAILCSLGVTASLAHTKNISDYNPYEKAQIITSILRFPTAAAANINMSQRTKAAHVASFLANAIRVADAALATKNSESLDPYVLTWLAHDVFKVILNSKNLILKDNHSSHIKKSEMIYLDLLLPLVEGSLSSTAALYNDNGKDTPRNEAIKRSLNSVISLSRVVSEFVHSEEGSVKAKSAAIALLVNALASFYEMWEFKKINTNPAPRNPAPRNPAPRNPARGNQALRNPAQDNPAPGNPAPANDCVICAEHLAAPDYAHMPCVHGNQIHQNCLNQHVAHAAEGFEIITRLPDGQQIREIRPIEAACPLCRVPLG